MTILSFPNQWDINPPEGLFGTNYAANPPGSEQTHVSRGYNGYNPCVFAKEIGTSMLINSPVFTHVYDDDYWWIRFA